MQKCISEAGVASRRTAEAMISAGRVTVNGRTAQLGAQADPETDVICIDGRPLPPRAPKRYIMLNKPRGYVTTMHDERGRKTVADLVASAGERLDPGGGPGLDSGNLHHFASCFCNFQEKNLHKNFCLKGEISGT